jgi:hypothetical protein
MVHIATLLHQAKFSMQPTTYQLKKTKPLPPAPAKFRVKLVEKRIDPLPTADTK